MTLNFSIRISLNRVSLSLKTLLITVQITKAFKTLQLALRASEERKTTQIHSKYSQGALHHHDFQQDQMGHLDPTWKQRKMGSNHKTTFINVTLFFKWVISMSTRSKSRDYLCYIKFPL